MTEELRNIAPGDYERAVADFEWDIPERHNLAVHACDRWAGDGRDALHWENEGGETKTLTFGDLTEQSNRFANALRDIGVDREDVVCTYLPTLPATLISMLGILKVGAIAMPVYHLFGPDGLSARLAEAEPDVIVTDATGHGKLQSAAPLPETVITVDADSAALSTDQYGDMLAVHDADFDPVETATDDPAILFYTSGTTGAPKGVLQPHRYSIGHSETSGYMRDLVDGDVLWHSGDLAWAGGVANLLQAWTTGVPTVKYHGRFDADTALDILERYPVTVFSTAPTALRQLMALPDGTIADRDIDVRVVAAGGERVTPDLLRWAADAFDAVARIGWAQTECYGLGWPPLGDHREDKLGSIGRPMPGFEATILDEEGGQLESGEVGELAIAREDNPTMFLRYYQDSEATAAVTEGRWHRTGDLALVDDGFFWYRGRADDVIISSGYRLSPTEIEAAVVEHQSVKEAAVVGVPDEERTNIPKAVVELHDGDEARDALAEAIKADVKADLATFQYPRIVEFVDELPKTITGKIERQKLRERSQ